MRGLPFVRPLWSRRDAGAEVHLTARGIELFAQVRCAVDRRVRDAALEAGYLIGCTTRFGINDPSRDSMLQLRTEIIASDSHRDFRRKVAGAWDWYALRQPDVAE